MERDRTIDLVCQRFFWPGMANDVERKIKNCERCLKRKTLTNIRVPLVNIKTHQPLEMVCVDFSTLEMSKRRFQHILVLTDHFAHYA